MGIILIVIFVYICWRFAKYIVSTTDTSQYQYKQQSCCCKDKKEKKYYKNDEYESPKQIIVYQYISKDWLD